VVFSFTRFGVPGADPMSTLYSTAPWTALHESVTRVSSEAALRFDGSSGGAQLRGGVLGVGAVGELGVPSLPPSPLLPHPAAMTAASIRAPSVSRVMADRVGKARTRL
jgi:hypothetical protein